MFGPVPYLLTSDSYDELLPQVLLESVPDSAANRGGLESSISQLIEILLSRKKVFKKRKPNIIALISALELEQFVRSGFVGSTNLNPNKIDTRKKAAVLEVRNVISLLKEQPIGVQIGVVQDSMPGTSFQILRKGINAQVATSPYRLGASANVRIGVATITSAREVIKLHQSVTENLWKHSLKGEAAVDTLEKLLQEF